MKKFDYTFRSFGTLCSITIVSENSLGHTSIINSCYKKALVFEQDFSRFREDSMLSKLNKEKKQEVNDDFLSLIDYSKHLYTLTEGYFNPLVDIRTIGYTFDFSQNKFEKIKQSEELNFQNVKNFGNFLQISQNMNLDFGSIAKGYFAEKISRFLFQKGFQNNLVNIGGDIYALGKNFQGEKWKISIPSPFGDHTPIDILELGNGSISTSGTYIRNWEINGEKFHHIKNPFSSLQEDEIVSISILHERGYMTDGLATAIIAMGKQKGITFCKKYNISFLMILKNGEVIKEL